MSTATSSTITVDFGVAYLKSFPGLLKILALVFNFIGFVCIVATGESSRGDAFLAACIIGFIVTGVLLALYVTGLAGKLNLHLLHKIEFFFCLVWVIFYLIVSSLVIDFHVDGYIAGGVFGLLAMIVYAVTAFTIYRSVPIF